MFHAFAKEHIFKTSTLERELWSHVALLPNQGSCDVAEHVGDVAFVDFCSRSCSSITVYVSQTKWLKSLWALVSSSVKWDDRGQGQVVSIS